MRKNIYRAFSALMIVVVLASSTMSSFASGAAVGQFVARTFGDWLISKSLDTASEFIKDHIGYSAGEQCESSPDGYHHCKSAAFGSGLGGEDENGRYTSVVCQYCGEAFRYYSSFGRAGGAGFSGKSDLQQSYDAQVQFLPTTGYNADGFLLWSPSYSYVGFKGYSTPQHYCLHHVLSSSQQYIGDGDNLTYSCGCDGTGLFRADITSDISSYRLSVFNCYYSGFVPVAGTYAMLAGPAVRATLAQAGGALYTRSLDYSEGAPASYGKGSEISPSVTFREAYGDSIVFFSASYFPPVYKVEPFVPVSGDTYNITSRPTSIIGDYGIIGDNGQITKVDGNTIVNETNNTVYNPVTNTTNNITDWQYDYSTRTYNVTLDNGNTQIITYGDENVSITEIDNSSGDTVTNNYTIYYLVEDSGADTPTPGPDTPTPCNHSWTETSTTPATCTLPGSKSLTCSLCGQTKTEAVPALGHTWTVRQTVNTQYDDTGQLTQEGYTIYECSVCGEQYKATDGGAPPGGGSLPGSGSTGGVFSGIFGLLVDFLGFFWNTFHDFVGAGVKGFLTALMDGTSSIFGLLNPFNWGG